VLTGIGPHKAVQCITTVPVEVFLQGTHTRVRFGEIEEEHLELPLQRRRPAPISLIRTALLASTAFQFRRGIIRCIGQLLRAKYLAFLN
jgi:hypothetical protein